MLIKTCTRSTLSIASVLTHKFKNLQIIWKIHEIKAISHLMIIIQFSVPDWLAIHVVRDLVGNHNVGFLMTQLKYSVAALLTVHLTVVLLKMKNEFQNTSYTPVICNHCPHLAGSVGDSLAGQLLFECPNSAGEMKASDIVCVGGGGGGGGSGYRCA